jgi:hypothetical protein
MIIQTSLSKKVKVSVQKECQIYWEVIEGIIIDLE